MINKLLYFFICSYLILTSPLQASEQVGEDDITVQNEGISKRQVLTVEQKSSFLSLTDNTLCDIVAFLPLPEAVKVELVCKQFSNYLGNSLQYQALITDWDAPKSDIEEYARSIFHRRRNNPEFQVHLADLWRNYFPLSLKYRKLPLTHYWETYIGLENSKLSELFHSIYKSHIPDQFKSPAQRNIERMDRINLITEQIDQIRLIRDQFRVSSAQSYIAEIDRTKLENVRTTYRAILNNPAVSRVTKELAESHMKKNQPSQSFFAKDCAYFLVVLNDIAKASENTVHAQRHAATAQYYMAEMDYLGIREPNYRSEMDYLGIREPNPNFVSARTNFWAVLNNPAADLEDKAKAQYHMAIMDYKSQGILEPNFARARANFSAVLNNPAANAKAKLTAQYYMAEMDYKGQGILEPDFARARTNFSAVLNNPAANAKAKLTAQYYMAEMDYKGQGILEPDFASTRTNFLAVLNSHQFFGSTQ